MVVILAIDAFRRLEVRDGFLVWMGGSFGAVYAAMLAFVAGVLVAAPEVPGDALPGRVGEHLAQRTGALAEDGDALAEDLGKSDLTTEALVAETDRSLLIVTPLSRLLLLLETTSVAPSAVSIVPLLIRQRVPSRSP